MTATTMHNHFPTLRKFKDKGRAWIVAKTDVVAIKIERLMIMCNGYNNIQPVRLSRGVATMVPHTTLMQQDQAGQYQFRPCLGSRRKSRGARDTRYDIVRKPNHNDQIAAANTRITFCASTDKLHWEMSQPKRSSTYIGAFAENGSSNCNRNTQLSRMNSTNQAQFCCDCGCTMNELDRQHDVIQQTTVPRSEQNLIKNCNKDTTKRFCCDCGCMIDGINEACDLVERKIVPRQRHRSRNRLIRQYTAPARTR